jgi:Fe-S cluster assembly protein SufD
MTTTASPIATDSFHAGIEEMRGALPSPTLHRIEALRAAGHTHFNQVGLPTTQDEEWRQTSLAPLAPIQFGHALSRPASVSAGELDRFAIADFDAHRLVFVDGRFVPELSDVAKLPRGAAWTTLAQPSDHLAEQIEEHLGFSAQPSSEPFVAINSACLHDGAVLHVSSGVAMDKPVEMLFVSTDHALPSMAHPRVLVMIEAGGSCDVIEHHVSLTDGAYLSNAVTEIHLGAEANASHYFIERDSHEAFNFSTLAVRQQTHSRFASHTVLNGGRLVRNNIHMRLEGAQCDSLLNGLYLPDGNRHMDNHMRVHHAAPNCDSRQFYTGILQQQASSVFIGRIVVDRIAQKTDAKQTNRNLLLSDDAYAHARPQLEIFADDVKCTHGATIGQLDEQAIFYLRSRGVPAERARAMLTYSFAAEALQRMNILPVRRSMEELLASRLSLDPADVLSPYSDASG